MNLELKRISEKFVQLISNNFEGMEICITATDGLPIASVLPFGVDETKMATITAALHSLAKSSNNENEQGKFNRLLIRSSDGFLITLPAGPDFILTIFSKDTRLPMNLDLKRISEKLVQLISSDFEEMDDDEDHYKFPYNFSLYCKQCGAVLPKGQLICGICGNVLYKYY